MSDTSSPSDRFDTPTTTHFGFDEIETSQKAGAVEQLFSAVAPKYDLMNDLMSGGVHRLWKAALIDWIMPKPGQRFLDMAGGTGDVADAIRQAAGGPDVPGEVLVADLTQAMLDEGQKRFEGRDDLSWQCCNAEELPFEANSFDVYTISFGLRNVARPERALAEANRVLKPGGRFFCLEFSQVVLPVFDKIYDAYSFNVLPKIGGLVANDEESYRYLVESIRRFPNQQVLEDMMVQAGFKRVEHRNYSGGIAAIHKGVKI